MRYRVFFDMDGTIAAWQSGKSLRELCSPGYFATLPPVKPMLQLAHVLHDQGHPVYILSAVLNEQATRDKHTWLDQYCNWVPYENRFFVPYGTSKVTVLKEVARQGDMMLDDYSANLFEIQYARLGIIPVKVMNGINGTYGTWRGARIRAYDSPIENSKKLSYIREDFLQNVA